MKRELKDNGDGNAAQIESTAHKANPYEKGTESIVTTPGHEIWMYAHKANPYEKGTERTQSIVEPIG